MLDDDMLLNVNETEIKNLAINCYSYLKVNGKKINYMAYIKKMDNDECNNAVSRVFNNIRLDEIFTFIDDIDCMSSIRKEFYKGIIKKRYEILEDVYNEILKI